MDLLYIIIAILVFILLWWLVDLLASLFAKMDPPPPFPIATIGHIILVIIAILWLVRTFLGGGNLF